MDTVEFGGEDGVVSRSWAAMFVAVAANAGDQNRLHLVLAWPLKDHGAVEACGDRSAVIARSETPLHARKGGVVGVAQRDDVGAYAATGRPHDGGVRVIGNGRLTAADADTGATVIGEFHGPILPRAAARRRIVGAGGGGMPGGSMPVGPPGLEVGSQEGGPVSRDPSSAR